MTPTPLARIREAVVAGAIGGLGAGLVFAVLHAFIIVPIWDRMMGGPCIRRVGRRKRGMVACAAATLALTIAMAGPVAIAP